MADISPGESPGPAAPRPGTRADVSPEDVKKLRQRLDKIEEQLGDARAERDEYSVGMEQTRGLEQNVSPLEDVYKAVVGAGFLTGVVGVIGSIVAGGLAFTPLFVIGTAFLAFAYLYGMPSGRG